LFLTKKFPFPPKDGECMAINSAARSLRDAGESIDLLAINTLKHYTDPLSVRLIDTPFSHIDSVTVDTNPKTLPLLKSLIGGKSYNLDRFNSAQFAEHLSTTLSEHRYSVVQLEGVHMYHYIPLIRKLSDAKIVLRSHNVEYEVWEKLAERESGWKKTLFGILAKRIRAIETKALETVDGVVTLTENDAQKFRQLGYNGPLMAMPIGIGVDDDEPVFHQAVRFFHIGSMDWLPNVEGLKWFVSNVWNHVNVAYPALQLHLAGRCFPDKLFSDERGVVVYGEVESSKRFVHSNDVLVVPLFSGSGVRLKILEAMSLGKAVVSTSKGAEGIPYTHDENILIADDAAAFVEQIKRCLKEPELLKRLGGNAKRLIRERYNPADVGQQLLMFYVSL